MFCPACGKEAAEGINFCQNCGQPLNPATMGEGAPGAPWLAPGTPWSRAAAPAAVKYAGFWLRFVAVIIDTIIVFIIVIGVEKVLGLAPGVKIARYSADPRQMLVVFLPKVLVLTVIEWLYWASMESAYTQATLGKMALGLKVTDLKGERISFVRATGRFFGKFVSGLILYVGYMMAGWTEKKQALHDMMAGTLVVRKRD